MLSSAVRAFARSSANASASAAANRSIGTRYALASFSTVPATTTTSTTCKGMPMNHHNNSTFLPFLPVQTRDAPKVMPDNSHHAMIFRVHHQAPVFAGFATPFQNITTITTTPATTSPGAFADPLSMLDTAESFYDPLFVDGSSSSSCCSTISTISWDCKRNRNNRPIKRANKGQRPCNRNARRNKKIKLGRRQRS